MTDPMPVGSETPVDEIDEIVDRVRQDRVRLTQALQAERMASADLRRRVDDMTEERSRASQLMTRSAAQIQRLRDAGQEMEQHYEQTLSDRDHQIGELRAQQDALGEEWSARFKRLAESHEREIDGLNKELSSARTEIETLQVELSAEKARTIAGSSAAELSERAGTMFIVDGDPLAVMIWPSLRVSESRGRLTETLEEYGQKHSVRFDVIFRSVPSSEGFGQDHEWVRVRVPHEGIPIEPVLRRLTQVHQNGGPVELATNRPGFSGSINLVRFAAQLGHRPPPNRPALEASSVMDPITPQNVITIDRS